MSGPTADGVIRDQLSAEPRLVALVGVAAWVQRNVRIRRFAEADRDLPLSLATGHRYRGALAVALFGLLGWLLYEPARPKDVPVVVAAAGLVGMVVIIASSVPMWNQILRYARGEPGRIEPSGRGSRTERP